MAVIYLVFITAAILLSAILLSRSTFKRLARQKKSRAILAAIRQPFEK